MGPETFQISFFLFFFKTLPYPSLGDPQWLLSGSPVVPQWLLSGSPVVRQWFVEGLSKLFKKQLPQNTEPNHKCVINLPNITPKVSHNGAEVTSKSDSE